jgi:hypothetical protein
VLLTLATSSIAIAAEHRSAAARNEFKRQQPCPATGLKKGTCPGWIIDHIVPLCAGGADSPTNMQWQTVQAAKTKDKEEWRQCRRLRKSQGE